MVTEINLKINNSILFTLNKTKDGFIRDMLFNTASTLYRNKKLSLSKAAELAGYEIKLFVRKLKEESKLRLINDEETDEDFFDNLQEALHF